MATSEAPTIHDMIRTAIRHPLRWILPAVVVGLAALGYALLRPPTWEAAQALVVRDEASGQVGQPGRFSDQNQMKSVQETILELGRSRSVVEAALRRIGPPAEARDPACWPSERDVEKAQGRVRLVAPNGAEFGRTEVFYLLARDSGRERAVALAKALCDEIDARFQQLRRERAESLIDELVKAETLARDELAEATARLRTMEQQIGSDLSELRILSESASGDGNLRQSLIALENELRGVEATRQQNANLRRLLEAALDDPAQLVAMPSRLLESQPALRRLKDGLVDAQLRTAELRGAMSEAHPRVQAAAAAEEEVLGRLHREIATALRGVEVDLEAADDRIAAIGRDLEDVKARIARLAGVRADYSAVAAEARHRTEILTRAQKDLADARASQAAALSASLIARIDAPSTGPDPLGPRKAILVLAGLGGGLLAGLGIVFLTAQPAGPATLQVVDHLAAPAPSPALHDTSHGRSGGSQRERAAASSGFGLSLKEALLRIGL